MPITSVTDVHVYRYWSGQDAPNGTKTSNQFNAVVTDSGTRSGVSNPRWRQQIRRHINAGTGMTASYVNTSRSHFDAEYEYGTGSGPYGRRWMQGPWTGTTVPSTTLYPTDNQMIGLQKEASIKLMLKFRNAQTQLQGLVSAGEFGETLRMLRNPAKALFEGIGGYLSSARRRAKKAPKKHRKRILQDTWLEYSFGWAPLVSDIEGAYKALHDLPLDEYKLCRVQVSRNYQQSIAVGTQYLGEFAWNWESNTTGSGSVKAYGEVNVNCTDASGSLARFGVRASEFLPTVWELIPYSFVADYFSNIGNVIAAGSFPTKNIQWSGMTFKKISTRRATYVFNDHGTEVAVGSTYRGGSGSASSSTCGRSDVTRLTSAVTKIGLNAIQFQIPGLSLKWLNLGALATASSRASASLRT